MSILKNFTFIIGIFVATLAFAADGQPVYQQAMDAWEGFRTECQRSGKTADILDFVDSEGISPHIRTITIATGLDLGIDMNPDPVRLNRLLGVINYFYGKKEDEQFSVKREELPTVNKTHVRGFEEYVRTLWTTLPPDVILQNFKKVV